MRNHLYSGVICKLYYKVIAVNKVILLVTGIEWLDEI